MTPQDLRAIRDELGITQYALGERVGVRSQTVWRWEHGRSRIPGPAAKLIEMLVQDARRPGARGRRAAPAA